MCFFSLSQALFLLFSLPLFLLYPQVAAPSFKEVF
jgi:hypothetical protein